MHPTPAERRGARSAGARRVAVLVLLTVPLLAWVASSFAALRAPARNPHGDLKEDCALCHDAKGWKPARISGRFNHAQYGFALAGAHAAADCRSCHATLEFHRPDVNCVGCHEDPHRGELGLDCGRCHGARSFVDRAPMVRAHQLTPFPLTGHHAALECESCHVPTAQGHMQFVNTRADCQGCHMKDYDAVREPDHRAGGFSTECAQCHTTLGWNAARVDHDRTAFPLTGAHRATPCASCHVSGRFAGTPTACVSCHRENYDRTQNPPHGVSGFGTDCVSCHTTANWDATFDHDGRFFPIYSGRHRTLWNACADCHVNATNYAQFSCLTCHPHSDQTETDGHHRGRSGYQYTSVACYSCHPRGNT